MKRICLMLFIVIGFSALLFANGSGEKRAAEGSSGRSQLVIWDQFYRPEENSVMEDIIKRFEKENPDIQIVREVKTLDDLKLVLQMAVQSGTGPDIMQLNQGEADMGAFVKSNLILDLTDTAVKMGWEQRLSKSNLSSMGYKGKYYGVSVTGEIVGFFYNKNIFKKLNLSVPKTLEELEKILADIKAAGYTPINFGNLDGWTGIHEWSALQHVLNSRAQLDNMMSGKKGIFWDSKENISAADVLVSWVKKGYFTPNFSAIGYDDSATVFYRGNSALMLTGNWLQGEINTNAPFETGFFLLPTPRSSSQNLKAVGGPGIPFVINKKTKHAGAAVKFLDFLTQKTTAVLWAENAMLPALPLDAGSVKNTTPLFNDIIQCYNTVNKINGMGYFIDWITPTFYDTCSSAVQKLMALEITPETFVKELQNDYNKFYR